MNDHEDIGTKFHHHNVSHRVEQAEVARLRKAIANAEFRAIRSLVNGMSLPIDMEPARARWLRQIDALAALQSSPASSGTTDHKLLGPGGHKCTCGWEGDHGMVHLSDIHLRESGLLKGPVDGVIVTDDRPAGAELEGPEKPNICVNCRHWDRSVADDLGTCEWIIHGGADTGSKLASVQDTDNYGAWFITRPQFGCVEWEAKGE